MNLQELLAIQKVFDDRIESKPSIRDYVLAIRTEMFELYNATEVVKWWKKSRGKGKTIILDEVADCMAFIFSTVNNYFDEELFTYKVKIYFNLNEEDIREQFESDLLLSEFDSNCITEYILAYWLCIAINFAMWSTNATLDEVIDAYKKKMEVNHTRQDQKY